MPDMTIIRDREDELLLVSRIFNEQGKIIPDLHYVTPHYQEIRCLNEYSNARSEAGQFFSVFDLYAQVPFELGKVDGGYYDGQYFVYPRIGGPTIDLLTSVEYEKEDTHWISDGGLSHYPSYRNTLTNEMTPAPEELKAIYKRLVKEIRRESKLIQGDSGRKYYIGPHTYERILRGELKLGVQGLPTPTRE